MVKKKGKKALGKGLRALIKDSPEGSKKRSPETRKEKHARNMEFYGSLMKKYVRSGAGDELIDQMLDDVRSHMGITKKEHDNLLETLRKRESMKPPRESDQKIAQSEIKEELSEIYKRMNLKRGKKKQKDRFKKLEESIDKDDSHEAITLTNGKDPKKKRFRKVIKRRLVARDLDERAGIVEGPSKTIKGKVEWSDEDEKPIMIPGPRKGLEDSGETIRAGPHGNDLEDSNEEIITPPPSEEGEEKEERTGKHDGKKIDEKSGPAIEAPPSNVPAGPGLGFEMGPGNEIRSRKGEVQDEITREVKETDEAIKENETEGMYVDEVASSEISGEEVPTKEEMIEEPDEEIGEMDEVDASEEETEGDLEDSLLSLKLLIDEDRIEEAYQMGERLLEETPDDVSVLNEMGVILYHKGMINEAIALYKGMLDKDPGSIETLINYATLLSVTGELDNSLECLDRAVKRDPYSEDAWNNKAVVLTRAGRLREALECLDEALRINEDSVPTWMNAGVVLERMGEIGPAMECYQNLLKLDPENDVALEGIRYCRTMMD